MSENREWSNNEARAWYNRGRGKRQRLYDELERRRGMGQSYALAWQRMRNDPDVPPFRADEQRQIERHMRMEKRTQGNLRRAERMRQNAAERAQLEEILDQAGGRENYGDTTAERVQMAMDVLGEFTSEPIIYDLQEGAAWDQPLYRADVNWTDTRNGINYSYTVIMPMDDDESEKGLASRIAQAIVQHWGEEVSEEMQRIYEQIYVNGQINVRRLDQGE